MPRLTLPDTRAWLAFALVLLLALTLALALQTHDRELAHDLAIGVRDATLAAVFFYFGSSKGAAETRELLGKALDKTPDADASK